MISRTVMFLKLNLNVHFNKHKHEEDCLFLYEQFHSIHKVTVNFVFLHVSIVYIFTSYPMFEIFTDRLLNIHKIKFLASHQ